MTETTTKTTKRQPNEKVLREELANKKSALEADGFSFAFDEKAGWEATAPDGSKIGMFEKLEKLLEMCQKTEETHAASLSVDQANRVIDFENNGWNISKDKENLWSGEKEINGKKVTCGKHESIEALFAQMETYSEAALPKKPELPLICFENCRVELTDEDILKRSYSLTKALQDLEKEEARFKAESDQLKSEHKTNVAAISARINKNRAAIDNNHEWREIECALEYDFEKSKVEIIRPDTGEIVKTRGMTKDEALAAGRLV